jgi:hypothetical protein
MTDVMNNTDFNKKNDMFEMDGEKFYIGKNSLYIFKGPIRYSALWLAKRR